MSSLQGYRLQREQREQARKQFLFKFEQNKKLAPPDKKQISVRSTQPERQPVDNHSIVQGQKAVEARIDKDSQIDQLLQQKSKLTQQLSTLEQQQHEHLLISKQKIHTAKQAYLTKLTALNQMGVRGRKTMGEKMGALETAIGEAQGRCREIEEGNYGVEEELASGGRDREMRLGEMRREYEEKLGEFEQMLQASTQKITLIQSQHNPEHLLQQTLNNPDQIHLISQNAQNIEPQIDTLLQKYRELLMGRQEILSQLAASNEVKRAELEKMGVLEFKVRDIFGRLEMEMGVLSGENRKMTEDLAAVGQLFAKLMPNSQ